MKSFQRLCHVQLNLDILFVKLTTQIGDCIWKILSAHCVSGVGQFMQCLFLGASITDLFYVYLAVSQTLGEVTLVQMFCWYVREKLETYFRLVACEDCFEVCFMGLVVERNFVWCLIGHSWHIYGICTSRSKKVWGMLKSHHLEVAMQVTESGTLFIGKAGCHYVILLYCETLL